MLFSIFILALLSIWTSVALCGQPIAHGILRKTGRRSSVKPAEKSEKSVTSRCTNCRRKPNDRRGDFKMLNHVPIFEKEDIDDDDDGFDEAPCYTLITKGVAKIRDILQAAAPLPYHMLFLLAVTADPHLRLHVVKLLKILVNVARDGSLTKFTAGNVIRKILEKSIVGRFVALLVLARVGTQIGRMGRLSGQ